MVNPICDSIETKYFVILKNLTYIEVKSLEDAFKIIPDVFFGVKKENNGQTKSYYNDDFFAHSRYRFFNSEMESFEYCEMGWKLIIIAEAHDRSREVFYHISDSIGNVRRISFKNIEDGDWTTYFQIEGICNIIKYIRELAKYPDWNYHDLKTENNRLLEENKELNIKINDLEDKFKNVESNKS